MEYEKDFEYIISMLRQVWQEKNKEGIVYFNRCINSYFINTNKSIDKSNK